MKKKLFIVLFLAATLTGCAKLKNGNVIQENKVLEQNTVSSSYSNSGENPFYSGPTINGNTDIKIPLGEALSDFQNYYTKAAITSVELEPTAGRYYYDITGVDDSSEYEVKIDAKTGEQVVKSLEQLDSEEQDGIEKENKALALENILSVEESTAIALKTVQGQGSVIECSLDKDLSITYWEITIQSDMIKKVVKIDATTGEILETELDD